MAEPLRIRIAPDGSFRLPARVAEKLGWKSGSTLEVVVDGEEVRLRRIEVDPFAEAVKAPDAGAFEKILGQQRQSQEEAFRTFEEKIRKPTEPPRPEDRPDYWR
jgi:AbrB family looped-hinge helix DNA binding protein